MLAIAGIQIIMQGQGLSPWKGGGFGMYSTYHWKQTEIWYRVNGKVHRLVPKSFNLSRGARLYYQARKFPNQRYLKELASWVSSKNQLSSLELQVWTPAFNTSDFTLTRKLIASYEYSITK